MQLVRKIKKLYLDLSILIGVQTANVNLQR